MRLRINSSTQNGVRRWQGTVTVAGLQPAKLVRQSDNSTYFTTRSAVVSSARGLARRFGQNVTIDEPVSKAAKKTVK